MSAKAVVQPDTDALFQEALALQGEGRLEEARSRYEALLQVQRSAHTLNNLGVLYNETGRFDAALSCFDALVAQEPTQPRGHANRGVALKALGRVVEARQAYETALLLEPEFEAAHANLGNLFYAQGQYPQALSHLEWTCARKPQSSDARFLLAKTLLELQQHARARAELETIVQKEPDHADAWGTLARVWAERHCMPEALWCFEQGVRHRPDYAGLLYNRGLARLLTGDLAGGFADYERRFDVADFPSKRLAIAKPLWTGQDLTGKTLLVHAEQGLGDTLQFLRYLPLLAQRAAQVLLVIQEPLTSLLELPANVTLVHEGSRMPACDMVCALLSLPHLLGASHITDIPQRIPYLRLDPARAASWQERFTGSKLRVGLVWAGNPSHKNDANRSMPLELLRPLLECEGVDFFSLQVGERSQDIVSLGLQQRVQDLSPKLQDFGDTAAALSQLDLLICVDTSIAHVAGALGFPVWLLLPWMPDWRWLLERDDSPWYPSMRLLRQRSYRDWGSVVQTLCEDLQALAAPASAAGRARLLRADALVEQGRGVLERGQGALAEPAFWQALRHCPTHARAASALAIAAYRSGHIHAAVTFGQRACRLNPTDPENWSNCGAFLKAGGRLDEALACQQQALELAPQSAQVLSNLGNTLGALGRWEEAIEQARQAVTQAPRHAEYHYNLGVALREVGQLAPALQAFRQAQALDPGHLKASLHEALLELLMGDLQAGWAHYETRWVQPDAKEKRNFTQPLWTGQPLQGKTLLVHAEQGFGDTLQFMRYVPLLAQRGARVVLVVQPELESLARRLEGCAQLVRSGATLPPFDYQCPLLSLPHGFGTTVEQIPCQVPYVQPLAERRAHWQKVLGPARHYRVALVWAGRPTHGNDANRSLPLQRLLGLTRLDGVELLSVQKGDAVAQLDALGPEAGIRNLSGDIHSFEDTAAILGLVDELITVDTSVAHLAGALGCQMRVLLPFIPDWRWLMDRSDSPWYPTARLYRQSRRGHWDDALQSLMDDVAQCARSGRKEQA